MRLNGGKGCSPHNDVIVRSEKPHMGRILTELTGRVTVGVGRILTELMGRVTVCGGGSD